MKKRLLLVIFAGILFFGMGGMAGAETFTLNSYNVSLHETDPGLVLEWSPILSQPETFNVALGGIRGGSIFLTSEQTKVQCSGVEDTVQYPISVSFNWTAPAGTVPDTVDGETHGWAIIPVLGKVLKLIGLCPAIFNFGTGGQFTIALKDADFGVSGYTNIEAKLTYVSVTLFPSPPP